MTTNYHIQPAGPAFIVIDPWGEQLVNTYPTEQAAQQDKQERDICRVKEIAA